MSIRTRILSLCIVLVLATAGVLVVLLFSVESQMRARVTGMRSGVKTLDDSLETNSRELMLAELHNLAKTCWRICDAAEQRTQSRLTYNLTLARNELQRMGGLRLSTETRKWHCINQLDKSETETELPMMLLGDLHLGNAGGTKTVSPVVDFVKQTTRDFCTVFQRMNEAGDMLRVCTSVINADGTPAVGTYIPHQAPDGTENPVIAAVLRGDTYRGRAFVVNDWHTTLYEPLRDVKGKVIGMLYVGTSQSVTLADLRQIFQTTVAGRTGYVWVLGGTGEHRGVYIVSKNGERDGENVWDERDTSGRLFIQEMIAAAITTQNGDSIIDSYPWKNPGEFQPRTKTAAVTYFKPLDWVIGVSNYDDDFMDSVEHMRTATDRAIATMDTMVGDVRRLIAWVAGAGIGIAITGIAAAVLFSRSISKPLTSLATRVSDLQVGHMDFVATSNRQDEIGVLERAFQRMTRSLRDAIDHIKTDEDRLRGISDAINDALVVRDAQTGTILEINRKMTEMFGYTPEEAATLTIGDISLGTPPFSQADAMEWLRKADQEGPQVFEWRSRRKNGELFWTEVSLRGAKIAGKSLAIAAIRDINRRRQAEEGLRESEERFRTIAETIPCAVYRCALDDRWTMEFISKHLMDITGYPSSDFIANAVRSFASIIYPDDVEPVRTGVREAVKVRHPWSLDYRIRHADGSLRYVYEEGQAAFDKDGVVKHLDGFVLDITERRKAQEERLRLEAGLRRAQKMEAVGTLSTGIAHDFNNLLTAISGYTEIAKSCISPDHPARQALDVVGTAVRDAGGIANSLLTFSRKTVSGKASVDLGKVVRDSLKLLTRIVPASIQVRQDLPDEDKPLYVLADVGQMHQVLMNLVTNAKDAMPDGGEIHISLSKENGSPDTTSDAVGPSSGLLVIADTGSGMPPDVVERIFDPFFTTKPRGRGTGLGMAIVHGIVEEHQGRIEVESEPGKGTRIAIRLPCCDPPTDDDDVTETAQTKPTGRQLTVLLAEDNEFVRTLIGQSLDTAGYTVVRASNGADAISAFSANPTGFHLAILDIELPKMSGLQCLEEIRRMLPDFPVILITGNPEFSLPDEVDEHLVLVRKPFRMADLIDRTKSMILDLDDQARL